MIHLIIWASLVAQMVNNLPALRETWVRSLSLEDALEEGIATHSSILAWRIPMDRGTWWATVHRVSKNQTGLKWFSMHNNEAGPKGYLCSINESLLKNELSWVDQLSRWHIHRMLILALKPNHADDRVHELTEPFTCFNEHMALKTFELSTALLSTNVGRSKNNQLWYNYRRLKNPFQKDSHLRKSVKESTA